MASEDLRATRIEKLDQLRAVGMNPFAYSWTSSHRMADLQSKYTDLPNGEEIDDTEVAIAGRIMARRVFGKLAFFTLQDETGNIQLFLDKIYHQRDLALQRS